MLQVGEYVVLKLVDLVKSVKRCLPAAKVRSMSKAEKDKVVRAKKSAAAKGEYKRSSKSNVKGARKKGATLRDWFEKENWINVQTGEACGK